MADKDTDAILKSLQDMVANSNRRDISSNMKDILEALNKIQETKKTHEDTIRESSYIKEDSKERIEDTKRLMGGIFDSIKERYPEYIKKPEDINKSRLTAETNLLNGIIGQLRNANPNDKEVISKTEGRIRELSEYTDRLANYIAMADEVARNKKSIEEAEKTREASSESIKKLNIELPKELQMPSLEKSKKYVSEKLGTAPDYASAYNIKLPASVERYKGMLVAFNEITGLTDEMKEKFADMRNQTTKMLSDITEEEEKYTHRNKLEAAKGTAKDIFGMVVNKSPLENMTPAFDKIFLGLPGKLQGSITGIFEGLASMRPVIGAFIGAVQVVGDVLKVGTKDADKFNNAMGPFAMNTSHVGAIANVAAMNNAVYGDSILAAGLKAGVVRDIMFAAANDYAFSSAEIIDSTSKMQAGHKTFADSEITIAGKASDAALKFAQMGQTLGISSDASAKFLGILRSEFFTTFEESPGQFKNVANAALGAGIRMEDMSKILNIAGSATMYLNAGAKGTSPVLDETSKMFMGLHFVANLLNPKLADSSKAMGDLAEQAENIGSGLSADSMVGFHSILKGNLTDPLGDLGKSMRETPIQRFTEGWKSINKISGSIVGLTPDQRTGYNVKLAESLMGMRENYALVFSDLSVTAKKHHYMMSDLLTGKQKLSIADQAKVNAISPDLLTKDGTVNAQMLEAIQHPAESAAESLVYILDFLKSSTIAPAYHAIGVPEQFAKTFSGSPQAVQSIANHAYNYMIDYVIKNRISNT